jgi:two-component system, NarL family, sensor histidine kinase UhpB
LTIQDDGIGFDPDKKTNGIGLKNVESSSNLFNGTMELISAPGQGCTLKISIPLKRSIVM